jgi:hypothetical protein
MIEATKNALIKQLFKFISPESISPENIKVNIKEIDSADDIVKSLQPGDLIFTKTSTALSETLRTIIDVQYDHVAVVLNNK